MDSNVNLLHPDYCYNIESAVQWYVFVLTQLCVHYFCTVFVTLTFS